MKSAAQDAFLKYWRAMNELVVSTDPTNDTEFVTLTKLMLRNQWRLSGPLSIQALCRETGLSYNLLAQTHRITEISQRREVLNAMSKLLTEYAQGLENGSLSLQHY